MSFSYYLNDESPSADGFLWATLATAVDSDARLLSVVESENGITMHFSKELSQEEIMSILLATLSPETIYTPQDNMSNDLAGQVG